MGDRVKQGTKQDQAVPAETIFQRREQDRLVENNGRERENSRFGHWRLYSSIEISTRRLVHPSQRPVETWPHYKQWLAILYQQSPEANSAVCTSYAADASTIYATYSQIVLELAHERSGG